MDTVAVNQRQAVLSGPNTVLALEYLLVAPGLYLVAGFAPYPARCSHAFVLEVTVTGRYASGDEAAAIVGKIVCLSVVTGVILYAGVVVGSVGQ
ncbi:hypothetical protein PI126_g18915 [Phytophthora idaei]|nr:hypothetical protein PI126_g18915 [Phytophthora idaei]